MIKPLNNVSDLAFKSKSGFENYQEQIKNKKEPGYKLTLSPGSDYQAEKPSFKKSVAGIFKGFNNVAGIVAGTVKGLVSGVALGAVAGSAAKNWKDKTSVIVNEAGKNINKVDFKGFLSGTIGDIWKFAGKCVKAIPDVFTKLPAENFKTLRGLPKKYLEYLGKGNKGVKAFAAGVAVLALGYNIIKSKIQANRKNANIDHSWNLKH